MKTKKRFLSILLGLALVLSLVPAFSMTALADGDDSTYTLTIPSTLTVANTGWNATEGISATGTLASGKKLTVTASSANSWALKSGDNSVGYNLTTATGSYSNSATPASWEFTAAELNANGGTNKAMGIIVEDYSSKPAGTYQDTVTFTAKVESAQSTALALNLTSPAVGQVIGDDGKNYDYASLPGGVTAVAKICYVSGSNGLALALADEGQMNWSTAISTCAAHTPAFTGGTWKLATQDEWTNMITAAGSYTALRDGFSSVGGSNLQSSQWPYYWSSTGNDSDSAWFYNFDMGFWFPGLKDDDGVYVRACLAF